MFYAIHEKEIREVALEQLDNHDICVGYLTVQELRECYEQLGLSKIAVQDCMTDFTHFRTSIDVYDEFSFGMINVVDVLNLSSRRNRIGFFIKKNLFLLVKIIDKDNNIQQMFTDAIGRFRQNATMEKVIYGVLERLLSSGNRGLTMTERQIMAMEREVVGGKTDRELNTEIFELRNRLSALKSYYEQLIDIGETLQENENDLFEEEDLRYFKIFTDKAERLSNNAQLLCDNLIHLREALDATLNYNLNNTMKLFTIVTIIFQPLTLIAGWYGMNFTHMPELGWKFGYLYVIVLCAAIVGGILYYFKKKKYL